MPAKSGSWSFLFNVAFDSSPQVNVSKPHRLGYNAAFSMAVGGMIGGGIFSTLGVVVTIAGSRAWISFLIGGMIALATAYSYTALTLKSGRAGGVYRFLREVDRPRFARIAAWILILGYTLTVAVYAFTFGAYVGHVIPGPSWTPHAMAAGSIVVLAGVNLLGVTEASIVEIVAVWGKLAALGALAFVGLIRWNPEMLIPSGSPAGWAGALLGAGVVFMAYEGFQLLAYDYEDMADGHHILPRVLPAAIVATMAVYVAVALGATMLVGADQIIAQEEVSLATAGRAAAGTMGFIGVTIAAALSTGSAINATLFATARLARDVARDGELPKIFAKTDSEGVPYFGIVLIAAASLVMATIGGIAQLVEGASFVFLAIFTTVNWLAFRSAARHRWISMLGLAGAISAAILVILHIAGVGR